jgi:hypothetical protein
MTEKGYEPRNYWRGPIWINMNWMLSRGLEQYGYKEKADSLRKDLIQLPIRFGFREYFDSRTGDGYGSDHFSWTAALFIDLVYEHYERDKNRPRFLGSRGVRRLKKHQILNVNHGASTGAGPDIAHALMACLGDLRTKFFDTDRGRVDYESMKQSFEYLKYKEVAGQLRYFDLRQLVTREQRLAFWINVYNVLVVDGIVVLGITGSVREVVDFFSRVSYQIGEFTFSLDDVEHGILRANARPPYSLFVPFGKDDKRREFSLDIGGPEDPFCNGLRLSVVCTHSVL